MKMAILKRARRRIVKSMISSEGCEEGVTVCADVLSGFIMGHGCRTIYTGVHLARSWRRGNPTNAADLLYIHSGQRLAVHLTCFFIMSLPSTSGSDPVIAAGSSARALPTAIARRASGPCKRVRRRIYASGCCSINQLRDLACPAGRKKSHTSVFGDYCGSAARRRGSLCEIMAASRPVPGLSPVEVSSVSSTHAQPDSCLSHQTTRAAWQAQAQAKTTNLFAYRAAAVTGTCAPHLYKPR